MKNEEGKVQIHGKTYLTVAYRVNEFRKDHRDWSIETEIIQNDDQVVIMKATIGKPVEGSTASLVVGTGYAEEKRNASQINRTSALENCETSAIGRALAACGFGGTEYASANEVQNAIQQQAKTQMSPEPINQEKVKKAVEFYKKKIDEDSIEETHEMIKVSWGHLTNDERSEVHKGLEDKAPGSRKAYKSLLSEHIKYRPEQ